MRHHFRPGVDRLESRGLLTGGVSLSNGMLSVTALQNSGNTATVSFDMPNNAVKLVMDGLTYEFPSSQVSAIVYYSGYGGGDTFTNMTNLQGIEFMYGGHDTVNPGTGNDFALLEGDSNTVHYNGGNTAAYVFGQNNTIDAGVAELDLY